MGLPQITYNSKTIDFPRDVESIPISPTRNALGEMSASGIAETLSVNATVTMTAKFTGFKIGNSTDEDLLRQIQNFYMWAMAGKAWTFARDSSKTALTTLTSAASSGAGSLIVASNTGIVIGQVYTIRSLTDLEIVKVSGISGTTISLSANLDNGYFNASRFRSNEYWPARLVKGHPNPITKESNAEFSINFNFTEDVNAL